LSTRRTVRTNGIRGLRSALRKRWQHDEAWERYDYAYSDEALLEWVPKISQLDEEAPLTLVYMNNHWRGQAVGTARQLETLMREAD
jgi:uncharacterized protein YecE (DUF72 family)